MISINATPRSLKLILKIIVSFSLLVHVCENFFSFPLTAVFSLNSLFTTSYFLWQPITAFFLIPLPSLAFSPLLDSSFLLMLFWLTSLEVYLSFGARRFFTLGGIVLATSSIAALLSMLYFSTPTFTLLPQVILSFATIWCMCPMRATPAAMLFFPMPTKWVLAIALLATVGYNTMTHDYVRAIAHSVSFITTYCIAVGCWYLPSPFPFLYRFDAFLKRSYTNLLRLIKR